jgi:hypothetical protein
VLESSVALPELAPARPGAAGELWRFRISPSPAPRRSAVEWFHEWRFPSGAPWLEIGRLESRYLARFQRTAAFVIDPVARWIVAHPRNRIPRRTIRHLLLDQIAPMLLANGDRLVVHASAVAGRAGAIAFIGPSGTGKSTMAAVMARAGGRLLTDDCLVVDLDRSPARVIPTYAGLRLWPDTLAALFPRRDRGSSQVAHYSSKRRIAAGGWDVCPASDLAPLRAACVLAPPVCRAKKARLDPLRGHAAFAAVLECTFHLDVGRRTTAPRALERVAALLDTVPMFRLQPPDDLARIDDACRLVQPLLTA